MLSGTGLPFNVVRGEFGYNGNRLTLERFLAFGEAIGVTANGWVDVELLLNCCIWSRHKPRLPPPIIRLSTKRCRFQTKIATRARYCLRRSGRSS